MHPVLLVLFVPPWVTSSRTLLGVLAALGFLLAGWAVHKHDRSRLVAGVVVGLGCALAAWLAKDHRVQLAPLDVTAFGLSLAAALAMGWMVLLLVANRLHLSAEHLGPAFWVVLVSGLLGARGTQLLIEGTRDPLFTQVGPQSGGLHGYGGLLVAGWALARFCQRRHLPLAPWLDAFALASVFGATAVRLGCHLGGCDFGRNLPASSPVWLARLGTFPRFAAAEDGSIAGSYAWLEQVRHQGLPIEALWAHPVHPTQLYEWLLAMSCFAFGWWWLSRPRFPGQLGLVLILAYGLGRFLLELLRGDSDRGLVGPNLAAAELGVVLLGGALLTIEALVLEGRWSRASRAWLARVLLLTTLLVGILLFRGLGGSAQPRLSASVTQWLILLTVPWACLKWRSWRGVVADGAGTAPHQPKQEPPATERLPSCLRSGYPGSLPTGPPGVGVRAERLPASVPRDGAG